MNNYITFEQLRKESRVVSLEESNSIIAKSVHQDYKNVFLSHSSKDKEHLPHVINFLENNGGSVYIDKLDQSLPNTTNHETAVKLKERIVKINKFVLFATENSKDSKWMPWELGIADGIKKYYDIAILPSAENMWEENWAEQEYLGIYKKIIWGSIKDGHGEDWIVKDFYKNSATYLKEWLKQDNYRGIL
jgi:hypothetical protein